MLNQSSRAADPNGVNGAGSGWVGEGNFRRRKARGIQDILIKITLTQTVIYTPQLPLVQQEKTQARKQYPTGMESYYRPNAIYEFS